MKRIEMIQKFIQEADVDGWLIYDFHGSNDLARLILDIPKSMKTTRRFYYWIPARGDPVKIVHMVEGHILDLWSGKTCQYTSWESLIEELRKALTGAKRVAMEYSPNNAIPYVSKVDGGTVDLIRSLGAQVVSSSSFLPYFTSVLTEAQGESHIRAGNFLNQIVQNTWDWISQNIKQQKEITDYDVQQKILHDFSRKGLITDCSPVVGVNSMSADPHYTPSETSPQLIRPGDFVLIDLWAKEDSEHSIYGDITRVAVIAPEPTLKQKKIFSIVRKAQRAATDFVIQSFSEKKAIRGCEVDDCARKVIRDAGYGDYFWHRTGHSIDKDVHGSGVHIDNFEMHDDRKILPGTCFSIEPGIYLPGEFGVRLEYDLYVHLNGHVEIVGGWQDEIFCLLGKNG